MAVGYMNGQTSGGIGGLLRLIEEEKANNPAVVPPASEVGAPMRGTVVEPLKGPNDPGSNLNVGLKPESGIAPQTAPPSPEGGAISFPQTTQSASATLKSDAMVPTTGTPFATNYADKGLNSPLPSVVPRSMMAAGLQMGGQITPTAASTSQPASFAQGRPQPATPGIGTKVTAAQAVPFIIQKGKTAVESITNNAQQALAEFNQSPAGQAIAESDAQAAAIQKQLESLQATVSGNLKEVINNTIAAFQQQHQQAVYDQVYAFGSTPIARPEDQAIVQKALGDKAAASSASASQGSGSSGGQSSSGQSSGGGGGSSSQPNKASTPTSNPYTVATNKINNVVNTTKGATPAPSILTPFTNTMNAVKASTPAPAPKASSPSIATQILNGIKGLFGRK